MAGKTPEWIKLLKKGNNEPLKDFFKEHSAFCVQRLTTQLGCQLEDAQDIFVEALLNLREKVTSKEGREVENVRAYLLGTCRNMLRKKWKGQQKHYQKIEEIERNYYDESSVPFDHLVSKETEEEINTDKMERISAIQESLKLLSDKCRKILTMFYVYEKSMTDIALAMNFSGPTVAKTSKSRCYKKWRELVNQKLN